MIVDGRVLGSPLVQYPATKAAIEALPLTTADKGAVAYVTDIQQIGWFDGGSWHWFGIEAVLALGYATGEPTGFGPNPGVTLAFNDATRTFTIAPTGASFGFFGYGGWFERTSAESVVIEDTVGLHFIMYYTSGTYVSLTAEMTPWEFGRNGVVFVATVYWNGANGVIGNELHGYAMDWATHKLLHTTIGARYISGLGGTFTNPAAIIVAEGSFADEDIQHDIAAQTTCRVFYRAGSAYTFTAIQAAYRHTVAGIIQYDDAGTLTDVTNNSYVAYWIFATNDPTTPIWALMGQREDGTIATARENNLYESLSLGTLPFAEMKLLYRVILRRTSGSPGGEHVETQDLRSVSNLPAGTYVPTDHNALAGREVDDSHPASAISNTPYSTLAATTVQAAINELVDEKEPAGAVATHTAFVNPHNTGIENLTDVPSYAGEGGKVLAVKADVTGTEWITAGGGGGDGVGGLLYLYDNYR